MKMHQHGAEIFNKICSFEVSIEVLPLQLSYQRIPVIEVSWKSVNMEPRYLTKCAVLKLAQGCCPSFWLSQQKNPCYRSLVKICQHGAEIFNKTRSFKVSIGLLLLISIISWKESLLLKSHENPSMWSWDI